MTRATMLSCSLLLLSLPATAQELRNPDHPLPPTAASITSSAPRLTGVRDAMPAPQHAPTPPPSTRRSFRRADATMRATLTDVLFDRPLAGGPLWALGDDWKASFDGTGFTFVPFFGSQAPRNFPLRVELDAVRIGGQPLPLPAGEPTQIGFAVHTPRGGLTEVVATSLRSVEQSFVFSQLPNRGAIDVEVGLTGEFTAAATADGLRLANEHGAVTYEKAVAIDATGARLELPIAWVDGEAHLHIPAAFVEKAVLPLVLDPLLAAINNIGSGTVQLQREADVATIQSVDRTAVVWRREFSLGDNDCFVQLFDSALAATAGPVAIDFTARNWESPAVAGSNYGQNFLVVSDVELTGTWYIAGRMVTAGGTLGTAQFDIEHNGFVGLPGNNFRPDVGGDFYNGTLAYFAVVFEKQVAAGNRDIYVKLVTQNGTLLTTNPSVVDNATTDESNPCISKANGSFNSPAGQSQWLVAYQSTWPSAPFDEEVRGRFVRWDGVVQPPQLLIGASIADELAPATSTPADIDGVRYWMVVYELETGGSRDIVCRVYDGSGALQATMNLNQSEAGGAYQAYDQFTPDVDSDGVRFVVGYTEPFGGTLDDETHVSTLAFLPATNTLRIDEARIGLGLSVGDEYGTRVCSHFSGGGQASPYYAVTDVNWTSNNVELYRYGGYSGGLQFSYFPSACGAPLAITPSGNTAIGNTVTITVANGGFSGTVFGYPGLLPLNALGCSCLLGVSNGLVFGNPLVWTVPANPAYVGTTLSVQGWTALGSNCLGFIDLSDTVDFTIR